jgi:hypothetical protein
MGSEDPYQRLEPARTGRRKANQRWRRVDGAAGLWK